MKLLASFKTLFLLIGLFVSPMVFPQLVITDPLFPTDDNAVVITFNATLGSGGLAGYTGDVYAHTGVITDESTSGTDWKYVKTNWGQNTPETKLTRIAADLYTLNINPDIRSYYGVPDNETILQMAFVFRSAEPVGGGGYLEGKTETGGDIFIDVYDVGLNVFFFSPDEEIVIVEPGDEIPVQINASYSNEIKLYVDDELIATTGEEVLIDTLLAQHVGKHKVLAIARNETEVKTDVFHYVVRGEVIIEELPVGIKNGINYIDETLVFLCLTAPGKDYVYVIGDFNEWIPDSAYYMKKTPDGEKFWLEINNLVTNQEYIFQYLVNGNLRIADPYTDKTSDPWNDKYIPEEVYPGLLDYPEDKTSGIASVLQTGQIHYVWEVQNFTPPPVDQLVIYELLIRDFTTQHTYQAVVDTLDYLQKLGVSAIELMPVNEFEGNSSWGYNPSFYFAPDKYYGPKNKLKKLIDESHKRGIAVLIDMVLNHSYDQSPFVQLYFDGDKPTEDNPWYNREHNFTNPDAQWGNDFNHESLYTQQLVDSINAYWMREYKIDGFRFDFTKGFGNNIKGSGDPWGSNYDADRIALLKRMADKIWERNPDALIILEHLAVNQEEKELADYGMLMWGNQNYNYAEGTMGYNENGKSDFSWISYQKRGWNYPHVVGYMESHDEERLMFKNISWGDSLDNYNTSDTTIALERMALAASFFYPVPGPKMIWQFGELGYDYSIDFNGRLGEKPVRWDYYHDFRRKYLYDVVSSLINLKKSYDVFSTDDYQLNVASALKSIKLNDEGMNVCIVGNFGLDPGTIAPGFQHTGWWYDYFYGDSINITMVNQNLELAPGGYHIYTDIKLQTPGIGTGIDTPIPDNISGLLLQAYPNPVSDNLNLEIQAQQGTELNISLYDYMGREVKVFFTGYLPKGKHIMGFQIESSMASGMYILYLRTDKAQVSRKMIIK